MMTVRFPNGFSLTYNDANYVAWAAAGVRQHVLYTKEGGEPIAKVPDDALIEWVRPCAISNPGMSLKDAIAIVRAEMRNVGSNECALLAALKRELRKFNIQTHEWAK